MINFIMFGISVYLLFRITLQLAVQQFVLQFCTTISCTTILLFSLPKQDLFNMQKILNNQISLDIIISIAKQVYPSQYI